MAVTENRSAAALFLSLAVAARMVPAGVRGEITQARVRNADRTVDQGWRVALYDRRGFVGYVAEA
jgi:hypothetical protein